MTTDSLAWPDVLNASTMPLAIQLVAEAGDMSKPECVDWY
jgi:hypothetical protein